MNKNLFHILLIPILISSCGVIAIKEKPVTHNSPEIIPMDLNSSRPVISVMLGENGPYSFIFDTGSSVNILDTKLAEQIGFESVGEDSLGVPGAPDKLVSQRVSIPDVNFSNTHINVSTEANVIDIRSMVAVDGIISPNTFSDYLITIDYPGSVLKLSKTAIDETQEDVSKYVNKEGIININLSANGMPIEGHMDSGSPGGFSLPLSMKDKLKFISEPVEAGKVRTPAVTFTRWSAQLDGEIKMGNLVYKNPEIDLLDGIQYANIGYQILNDMVISLDVREHLISLERVDPDKLAEKMSSKSVAGNEYTGYYGGGERRIFIENEVMYLQRGKSPKLKLVWIDENTYKMEFPMPVRNELPNVRFEKDLANGIKGLTFVFSDGREDFIAKDNS